MKKVNNSNTFEQVVKNKLDNLDLPYDEAGWANIEQEISGINPKPTGLFIKVASIITAIVVISAVSLYYINSNTNNSDIAITETVNINNNQITKTNTEKTTENITNNNINIETAAKETKSKIIPKKATVNKTIAKSPKVSQLEKEVITQKQKIADVNKAKEPQQQRKLPNAKFTISKLQTCDNQAIVFTPLEIADSIVYHWEFGDGKISSKAITTHIYNKEGDYPVSLTIRYKVCKLSATYSLNESVVVYPSPNADFKVEHIINTYSFIPEKTDANISWKFSEGQITEDNLYAFTFIKSGIYPITCIAENSYNCIDKVSKNIEVEIEHYIPMPNAFTPDGDGLNDVFGPPSEFCNDYDLTFKVFDKTGILLFESNSADKKWIGTANGSNTILKRDVYVWILITKDMYDNVQTKKGTVSLIK